MISLMLAATLAAGPAEPGTAASRDRLDPNRTVCRRYEETGSRTRHRYVCLTVREWNDRRENITRGMRDFVTREMASMPPPPTTDGSD